MSYSGDAAEQVVRLSLETGEVAAKIVGAGAKQVAVLLCAVLREQKKTKGKTRLSNMLRSGKELKVFAVSDADLQRFCTEAKKYGVLYCVLKDRDANDGITDVMVRAEDASKINRIFERFQLSTVDIGKVKAEIQRDCEEQPGSITPESSEEAKDGFLDALLQPQQEEAQAQNPTEPQPESPSPSAPISAHREGTTETAAPARLSVREELKAIQAEQRKKQDKAAPKREQKPKTKPKKKVKEK